MDLMRLFMDNGSLAPRPLVANGRLSLSEIMTAGITTGITTLAALRGA